MTNIKEILIGILIGCIATVLVYQSIKTDNHEKYELKSVNQEAIRDSINALYNIKIDSLNGVIDSIKGSNKIIETRLKNRNKKDIINYESIMQSNPDSSYISVKRYLDSAMSDTTR